MTGIAPCISPSDGQPPEWLDAEALMAVAESALDGRTGWIAILSVTRWPLSIEVIGTLDLDRAASLRLGGRRFLHGSMLRTMREVPGAHAIVMYRGLGGDGVGHLFRRDV